MLDQAAASEGNEAFADWWKTYNDSVWQQDSGRRIKPSAAARAIRDPILQAFISATWGARSSTKSVAKTLAYYVFAGVVCTRYPEMARLAASAPAPQLLWGHTFGCESRLALRDIASQSLGPRSEQ